MSNSQFRMNNCALQYSTDNGLSWHNVTGWDSAISECFSQRTTPSLDALTDEQCCGVAKYLISWFDELFNDWLDNIDGTAATLGLAAGVAAIVGVFTPFSILIPLVSEIAITVVERGTNAIRASYTSQVREELESLLYCMIRANNNRFTYAVLDQWRQTVTGSLGVNTDSTNTFNFARYTFADIMLAFTQEEIYRRAYIGSLDSSAACAAQYTCQNNLDLIIDPPSSVYFAPPTPYVNDPGWWKLTSTSSPNENGYYVVYYKLPYPMSCARFELRGIGDFQHPQDAPFAGFRTCGLTEGYDVEHQWMHNPPQAIFDLYTVGLQIKPCFNAFYIRSTAPFELDARITECVSNTWCHTFDFLTSLDGLGWDDGSGRADHVVNQGWARQGNSPHSSMFLNRILGTRLTRLEMTLSSPIGGQSRVLLRLNGNTSNLDFTDTGTQISRDFTGGVDISDIWLGVDPVNGVYYGYIQRITLYGTGSNPFVTNNCP